MPLPSQEALKLSSAFQKLAGERVMEALLLRAAWNGVDVYNGEAEDPESIPVTVLKALGGMMMPAVRKTLQTEADAGDAIAKNILGLKGKDIAHAWDNLAVQALTNELKRIHPGIKIDHQPIIG